MGLQPGCTRLQVDACIHRHGLGTRSELQALARRVAGLQGTAMQP